MPFFPIHTLALNAGWRRRAESLWILFYHKVKDLVLVVGDIPLSLMVASPSSNQPDMVLLRNGVMTRIKVKAGKKLLRKF